MVFWQPHAAREISSLKYAVHISHRSELFIRVVLAQIENTYFSTDHNSGCRVWDSGVGRVNTDIHMSSNGGARSSDNPQCARTRVPRDPAADATAMVVIGSDGRVKQIAMTPER
jgi:hypothetical protein